MMDTQKVGGWTPFAPVTKEEEKYLTKQHKGFLA